MNKLLAIALILPFVLLSCKKDKLEGDRSILEGKWEWIYAIKTKLYTNGSPSISDTINSSDVSSTFGLEFLSKGKVRFIENEEIREEYRTVFYAFKNDGICQNAFGGEAYQYIIRPNNEEEIHFNGCVSIDTLTFHQRDFPFSRYSGTGSKTVYKNFFKKVN